jgi:hypothetical protein
MGDDISLVRPRTVTGRGEGLASHAGLVWLGGVADAVGLAEGLERATGELGWRRHRPGRTLGQMVLALADGADCLSDLAALRDQPGLFGPVASQATAWRTFDRLGPAELRGIDGAVADARAAAWDADRDGEEAGLIIDIDATLIATRADKGDAAATYKRTYGHHPLLAMIAERGEILAGMLRPGNAGSNTAEDHVVVLSQAIDALPEDWRRGHQPGDPADQTAKELLVRADSAGASHWLAEECQDRNSRFSFGYQITGRIRDALLLVQEEDWVPAHDGDGCRRDGAWVSELSDLVDMAGWPPATRLICRRERPHPGAQLSLFDTVEGFRHQCVLTDQPDADIAVLEWRHRQRGQAESVIRDAKACGLANLPFDCVVSNDIWCRLVAAAVNLLAWARRLTLTGRLRRATPKTLRYRLLHTAGRLTRRGRRLDLDANWPWTTVLLNALDRLHTLFPPRTVTKKTPPQPAL